MGLFAELIAPSETRGISFDDPRLPGRRLAIVERKRFFRRIYEEWYERLVSELPAGSGPVLELGAGAGFFGRRLPGLVTSEVFWIPHARLAADAQRLPVASGSLRAIVMTNVLHHLPRVRSFFAEAERVLRPGGVVAMLEPWLTPWSRFVYTELHHEACAPDADTWEFAPSGPLSAANDALAWVVFARDRAVFTAEFPHLAIRSITPTMPLVYLVSGGFSTSGGPPEAMYGPFRRVERALGEIGAMFAYIVLQKR